MFEHRSLTSCSLCSKQLATPPDITTAPSNPSQVFHAVPPGAIQVKPPAFVCAWRRQNQKFRRRLLQSIFHTFPVGGGGQIISGFEIIGKPCIPTASADGANLGGENTSWTKHGDTLTWDNKASWHDLTWDDKWRLCFTDGLQDVSNMLVASWDSIRGSKW